MGLPQVSSNKLTGEVPSSLDTFVQTPPHVLRLSSCDLSGICVGNRVPVDIPISSLKENPRDLDGSHHLHGLKIESSEKSAWCTNNTLGNLQTPLSRIVGFEPKKVDSSTSSFGGNEVNDNCLGDTDISETVTGCSQAKERLLSPLNGTVSQDRSHGKSLVIGGTASKSNVDNISPLKEHKKANIGSYDYLSPSTWSALGFSDETNHLQCNDVANSILFTDGPFIVKEEFKSFNFSSISPTATWYHEKIKEKHPIGEIAIPSIKLSPSSLSLSPLRPKFFVRRINKEEIGGKCLILCRDVDKILRPNFEYLKRCGFGSEQVTALVSGYPHILIKSINNSLEPRIKFLLEVMKRRIEEVVEYPDFFGHGLKKKLEVRHKFLKQKNIHCSLSEMLELNQKKFLLKYSTIEQCV